MLKGLRRKFIVIVMVLVGTVLVAVLGSSYVATARHGAALSRAPSSAHCTAAWESFPMAHGSGASQDDGKSGQPAQPVRGRERGHRAADERRTGRHVNTSLLDDVIMQVVVDGRRPGPDLIPISPGRA